MRLLLVLAISVILLNGCGGTTRTGLPDTSRPAPEAAVSPIPDNIGLILQCNKCIFIEEQGARYFAGQIHNEAKQAVTGYVLAVDLQDAKGKSLRKIDGLMLMEAIILQPGETKEFKERISASEPNVAQAIVYFKKAGRNVKLSNELTLKLTASAPASAPAR